MILVLGASGYIGNNLYKSFLKEGFDVTGTYSNNKIDGLIHFDIRNMNLDKIKFNKKIRYVIIASGININIDNSKKDWKNSYYVNVTKTKIIIDYCFENNIIPIYISSDGVFDGLKGGYIETDKKNPVNCYGTIKNEVEDYLLKSGNKFMILRMGRVFGTDLCDDTIITNTIRQLKERKTLLCANDEIFTPLYIEDLCKAIIKLIRKRYEGVLHLISIESISRYEIAKTIQKYFNLRNIEIIPCKINSLGLLEKRPLLINLDDNKFNNLVKTEHCDIKHYLEIIDAKS
jgi:dTDP-4-dehydrorhamnose reductase|tara:strand:- start:239 stop:1102 length:864 start_codon:yes stop_codon:yes gene_type:complete